MIGEYVERRVGRGWRSPPGGLQYAQLQRNRSATIQQRIGDALSQVCKKGRHQLSEDSSDDDGAGDAGGGMLTSNLSIRCPSMSITSKSKPFHSSTSPVRGILSNR